MKKYRKDREKKGFLRYFFVILSIMAGVLFTSSALTQQNNPVYAVPGDDVSNPVDNNNPAGNVPGDTTDGNTSTGANGASIDADNDNNLDNCQNNLGGMAWLVCTVTGKTSDAVDWLYGAIEGLLVVNPVKAEDGTPIYEIWKYCRGITNIVFIIFLLIVIYSQITGVGISNYGIKKALPKLIVAAVLVNLSFLICQLGIDLSNIVGNGLRGIFTGIEESVVTSMNISSEALVDMRLSYAHLYGALAAGSMLAIGAAVISFETGAIWMLIPIVLAAVVAVASGLITIALRQAVVALLVMIAPLAFVAKILPNTEKWYEKWKQVFLQMLMFFPMFSLLFGASSLAGFAIMASAKDGFWLLLGAAVQVLPLFFSWSMMRMSGTVLGSISNKMYGLMSRPVASSRAWANSRRQLTRSKMLASNRVYTPSLALMQYMSNRKIAREAEIAENEATVKNRGLAYRASKNYDRKGAPTREGAKAYAQQAENMRYMETIERDKNNMNKGLGQLAVQPGSAVLRRKLAALDGENVTASDRLKVERARGEVIEYENALGFHKRMEDAVNVHFDDKNQYVTAKAGDGSVTRELNKKYKMHDIEDRAGARARYNTASKIMEGNLQNVQYAAATAAYGYDAQKKMVETKMGKYFELTPPTKDVEYRLGELTKAKNASGNIDSIVAGLRVLNQRGDTDLMMEQIDNMLDKDKGGGIRLGTHASQSLASFLMFEVKDADPWMRRFGKYINLETARVFNKNERQELNVTYDEYVKGYHMEPNASGELVKFYAKKGMKELMEGTSLDGIERTALSNYDDSLIRAFTNKATGKLDVDAYLKRKDEIETSIGPAFISASLKYLSGSEQIASAVKAKTGYGLKQKEDGTYEMVPIWEDAKYKTLFEGQEDRLRKWYQDKTLKYLADQTPSQILGLRSDYKGALYEHLAKAYEESDMKGWSEESIEERREIMAELAELQTKYGDLTTDEAKEKYARESEKIKKKMVGAQFRQLLDSKGKLNQIYRTRRSGAANNAKDWVREWLELDDEVAITAKLEDDKRRMKAEFKKEMEERNKRRREKGESDSGVVTEDDNPVYDTATRSEFVSHIEDMWYDLQDESDDAFYDESLAYIIEKLGEDSFIVAQYKHFRKNDKYADSHTLKEFLKDLLSDPDNY